MDELTYFDALAKEVIKSKDPRLMKLLEWCDDINIAIKACEGNERKRPAHSAVMAGALLMEAVMLEQTQQSIVTRTIHTPYNKKDAEITKFCLRIPEGKREIEVSVEITDFLGCVNTGRFNFQPLILSMSESTNVEKID